MADEVEAPPEGAALEEMTVAELQQLAEEQGVDVPKSAKKADLVAALTPAEPDTSEKPDEPPAPEGPTLPPTPEGEPLEELAVLVGDAGVTLTVNGNQFALTRDDVARAHKAFDVAFYELH